MGNLPEIRNLQNVAIREFGLEKAAMFMDRILELSAFVHFRSMERTAPVGAEAQRLKKLSKALAMVIDDLTSEEDADRKVVAHLRLRKELVDLPFKKATGRKGLSASEKSQIVHDICKAIASAKDCGIGGLSPGQKPDHLKPTRDLIMMVMSMTAVGATEAPLTTYDRMNGVIQDARNADAEQAEMDRKMSEEDLPGFLRVFNS